MYLDCQLFIIVIKAIQPDCDKVKGISVLLLETPLTRSKYIFPIHTHTMTYANFKNLLHIRVTPTNSPTKELFTSSQDESKQRRKKKKHRRPRRSELKVTTQGLGTDDPVWTNTGSAGSSSSTASSHSEGDSGLGSNLRVTDTEPQTRAPLRASPDARRDPTEVIEDAPLSDRGWR